MPSPPRPGGPFVMTALFLFVSVALLGSVGRAFADRAGLRNFAEAAEGFRPRSRRTADPRARAERDRCRGAGAQRDASPHPGPGRGPHPDAGRARPRLADAAHAPVGCAPSSSPTTPRRQILCDVDRMKDMTQAAVSWIMRDGQAALAMMPVDAASIPQTICDEFAGHGSPGRICGPRSPDHRGAARRTAAGGHQPGRQRGALRPGRPCPACAAGHDHPRSRSRMTGRASPPPTRSAMLQPFIRGDEARNMDEPTGFWSRPRDRQRRGRGPSRQAHARRRPGCAGSWLASSCLHNWRRTRSDKHTFRIPRAGKYFWPASGTIRGAEGLHLLAVAGEACAAHMGSQLRLRPNTESLQSVRVNLPDDFTRSIHE